LVEVKKDFEPRYTTWGTAIALWAILCSTYFVFRIAHGLELTQHDRFGVKFTQHIGSKGEIRVLEDRQTGARYLFYRDKGGVGLCPMLGNLDHREDRTEVSRGDPRRLQVVATAYTSGPESTGKKPGDPGYGVTYTGLPAAHGICAVDPAVIPFGTVLYVPGYGYAVAGDTGSVIKGSRIDLFFPTVEEARRWGVRRVEVLVVNRL